MTTAHAEDTRNKWNAPFLENVLLTNLEPAGTNLSIFLTSVIRVISPSISKQNKSTKIN